jgi:hypothetical protein
MGGGIHREVVAGGVHFADGIVVVAEHSLLPKDVAIEQPEYQGGKVGGIDKEGVGIVRGEREQRCNDDDAPAFEADLNVPQVSDDALDQLEMA